MRASVLGFLLFAGFLFVLPASAQDAAEGPMQPKQLQPREVWRAQNFTIDDGLPGETIYKIIEDRTGYLWLGTSFGLARYDGYAFEHFLPGESDSTHIGEAQVETIQEDADGRIWIGGSFETTGGASVFDPRTERFSSYRHDPANANSLVNDRITVIENSGLEHGEVWLGGLSGAENSIVGPFPSDLTGGLSRLNVETGNFTNYRIDLADPSTLRYAALTMMRDREGTRWTGGWGLNRLGREAADSVQFSTFLPRPEIDIRSKNWPANVVGAIHESPSEPGVLWLGGAGLHRFDVATSSFDAYYPSPGFVNTIFEDRTGEFWVGTDGGGLYTFDRAAGRFTRFPHQPPSPVVNTITEDRYGVLWIGSLRGLMKLERKLNPFTVHTYTPGNQTSGHGGIYVDRVGQLWVSIAPNEIKRINLKTGETTTITSSSASNRLKFSLARFYEDGEGAFWVSGTSERVLNRLNRNTGQVTRYEYDPGNPYSISPGHINGVLENRHGGFWVGVHGGGLNRMDPQTGRFIRYQHDPDDPESLVHNDVLRLDEDAAGRLWIGTEYGLSRFEPDTETFSNYTSDLLLRVMMVHEDRKGRFWIASAMTGLHLFDPTSGRIIESFTTEDGLASNVLYSVYEDADGMLWVSTGRGLSQIDPETRSVVSYTTADGLPFDQFVEGAHYQTTDGELFFGGGQGVISFYPDQLDRKRVAPEVVIKDLRIAGEPVPVSPEGPLKEVISATRSLTLPYQQNDLAFDYVGLHSVDPSQIRYRYQLEGFDTDWIEAGTQRSARYPRLQPGDYTFRVAAASSEGVWNEEGASVRITILQPWWGRWWAYVVYGLLFVVGVYGVDRFQRKRIIARERLRAEREKAKAIESTNNDLQRALKHLTETQDQLVHTEKMASLGQLTAGIAHEIKNPLNFVNNFAQLSSEIAEEIQSVLEREKTNLSAQSAHELKAFLDDLKLNTQKINEHGQRADGVIRAMLEHSRADRGERRPTGLNKLVDEYANLAYHGLRAREDGFEVELSREYDSAVAEVDIYPQEIGRVMINLLDNAFYAVNERRLSMNGTYTPRVSVQTKKSDGHVEVWITDNGAGIPEEVRGRIFEPFFTTKPAGSGTGLGLSLSYDIVVKGHGGNLDVYEAEGGATFIVRLPMEKG